LHAFVPPKSQTYPAQQLVWAQFSPLVAQVVAAAQVQPFELQT
jgi:hypothetical protein